jgi:hypothetical protein
MLGVAGLQLWRIGTILVMSHPDSMPNVVVVMQLSAQRCARDVARVLTRQDNVQLDDEPAKVMLCYMSTQSTPRHSSSEDVLRIAAQRQTCTEYCLSLVCQNGLYGIAYYQTVAANLSAIETVSNGLSITTYSDWLAVPRNTEAPQH